MGPGQKYPLAQGQNPKTQEYNKIEDALKSKRKSKLIGLLDQKLYSSKVSLRFYRFKVRYPKIKELA